MLDCRGCRYGRDLASATGAGRRLSPADYGIVRYCAVAAKARECPDGMPSPDLFDKQRAGAHALWIKGGAVTTRSAAAARGARPWSQ